MAKKNEKDKGKDAYSVLMSSLGLDDSAGSSKPAASSSKPAASSSKPASTKSKDKGSTTAYDALMTSLSQSGISKSKASRKDKWDAFWESIGKNAKAGATNSTVMNQQHYWSKNDPTAEKYVERRLSGMNTDVDMDRGLNENYVTERFLKNVFDPNNMVGQERGQGSRMYTQEDADKAIAKADTYWEKQQGREEEARAATQNAFDVIDPDTRVGEIALSAANSVAYTLPSMAKDAALTAASAGTLGPTLAAAGVGRMGIRLATEMPTITVRTARYFDQAFQDALENGATQDQAVKAASEMALPNALIESAGGLDALATKLVGQAGKAAATAGKVSRAGKVMRALEVPFSEGVEESLQGIVERGAIHRNYDEDTVAFDARQILDDFMGGAAGGAILGSVMGVMRKGLNANSRQELESTIKEEAANAGSPVSDETARNMAAQMMDLMARRTVDREGTAGRVAQYETNRAQQEAGRMQEQLNDYDQMQRARQGVFDPITGQIMGPDGQAIENNTVLDEQTKRDIQQGQSFIDRVGSVAATDAIRTTVNEGGELTRAERFAALLLARQTGDAEIAQELRDAAAYYNAPGDTDRALTQRDYTQARENLAANDPSVMAQELLAKVENGQTLTIPETAMLNLLLNEGNAGQGDIRTRLAEAARVNEDRRHGWFSEMGQEGETLIPVAEDNAPGLANAETATVGRQVPVENTRRNRGLVVPEGEGREQAYGFTENTLHNAVEAGTVDEGIEKALKSGIYATVTNEQSLAQAQAAIDKYGAEAITQRLIRTSQSSQNMNSTEYVAALTLIKQYSSEGDFDKAETMAEMARNASNDAGRLLQLTKTLVKSSPELYVLHATRQLRRAGVEISESRQKVLYALSAAAQQAEDGEWDGTIDFDNVATTVEPQAVGIVANPQEAEVKEDFGITDKQKQRLSNAVARIHKYADKTGMSESEWLQMLAASQQSAPVKASIGEVVTSWRRISMLLNPKTMIVRNVGGNTLNLLTEVASDPAAALVAQGLKKLTNGDASAIQAGQGKALGKGFYHGMNAAWMAYKTGVLDQMGGNKYINDDTSMSRLGGASENVLWQAYRGVNDLVSLGLTALDKCFSEARQEQVEAQYAHALGNEALSEEQQALAEEAGKYVTFQNDSALAWLAVTIRSLGEKLQTKVEKNNGGALPRALAGVVDAALKLEMPFAKTPGNILSAAINLTPVSLVGSVAEVMDEWAGQKTLKNMPLARQRRIAVGVGRFFTGAALGAVGWVAANAGKMTGDEPEDQMEEDIWAMMGKIPHSIKIGNTYQDMSSMGPAFVLMNAGATLYEELKDTMTKGEFVKLLYLCVFRTASGVMSDVTGDQLWSGVLDLAGNIAGEDGQGMDLKKMVEDIAGDAVSQLMPFGSTLRQFAYTLDEYMRETSGEKERDWIINRQKSGLPGLSKTLPEKIGITGEEKLRYPNADNAAERAFNAFLNPASTISEDRSGEPWLQELARLARATDDKSFILGNAPYKLGKDYALFGEERSLYQKTRANEINQFMTELLGDDYYDSLSTEEQSELVRDIMNLATYDAKKAVADTGGGYVVPDSEKGSKMAEKMDEAQRVAHIDVPTYLIYESTMDKDYSLKYRPGDAIPVTKSGPNKGQPKGEVGDVISSGKKKGAAWAIKQQFSGDLTVDQMYYLWTLQSPSGDSAWKEVKNGGKDNDYYRFFKENWTEDNLRNL